MSSGQRYDLLRPLASGGMGEVYLAELTGEAGFRKRVALKRVKPELSRDPSFVERFIAEAKLAVTLSHANIVQTLDLGRLDDTLFLAMEYVDGVDLMKLMAAARDQRRAVPVALVLHVALEALRALAYAHQHIVHCDVSPSNLLVSYAGEVKLTDFGVAMWSSVADRPHGTVVGKLRYLAPEVVRGEGFDARADLYALGVVLRELCELEPAFVGSPDELRRDIEAGACRLRGRPDVPPAFEALMRRATAPSPAARPASAARLLTELSTLAAGLGGAMPAPEVGDWVRRLVPSTPEPLEGVAQFLGARSNGTQSAPPSSFLVRRASDGLTELQSAAQHRSRPATTRLTFAALGLALTAGAVAFALRPVPSPAAAAPAPVTIAVEPREPLPVVEPRAPVAPAPPPVASPKRSVAATTRPQLREGYLNVSSEPWAHVRVDGQERGTTPLYRLPLLEGPHVVVLVRDGATPLERRVRIEAGQTQLLDLDLQ